MFDRAKGNRTNSYMSYARSPVITECSDSKESECQTLHDRDKLGAAGKWWKGEHTS